jgi:hypothetical protein
MAGDYYGNELIATQRVHDRYQYAEAHRLANGVSKDNQTRHSVLMSAGQAMNRVIQAVLCKLYSIWFAERLSPCSESP